MEFSHLTKGRPAGNHWTYGKWISTERGKAPSYGWRNRCATLWVQLGKTLKANGCTQVQTIAGYRDELFLTEELGLPELFMWQQKMAVREQREMYWMLFVSRESKPM